MIDLFNKRLSLVHQFFLSGTIITMLLPIQVQRLFLIGFGLTVLCDIVYHKKWTMVSFKNKESFYFLGLILLYLALPLTEFLQTGSALRYSEMSRHFYHNALQNWLPFMVIGLVGLCGFKGMIGRWSLRLITYSYLLAAAVFGFVILYHMIEYQSFTIHWQWNLNDWRNRLFAPHMEYNLYLNTGLVFGTLLLHSKWKEMKKFELWALSALMVLSLLQLSVSSGRAGQLSVLGLVGILLITRLWRFKRWLIVGVMALGLVFSVLPILNTRFSNINATNSPRMTIWDVSMEAIEEHPILGFGYAGAKEILFEKGTQNKRYQEIYASLLGHPLQVQDMNKVHTHNVFLQFWLIFGLAGLLLFGVVLLLPLTWYKWSHFYALVMMTFIYLFQGNFEVFGSHLRPLDYSLAMIFIIGLVKQQQALNSLQEPSRSNKG